MKSINDLAKAVFGKSSAELGPGELEVLKHAQRRVPLSTDINAELAAGSTFGGRVADGFARIGGSWGFIIGFVLFLAIWTVSNTWLLTRSAFDPYPFIFLNLVLSMVAALQAPIIMMSQNRQSERDRFAAAKDYQVNLKAEIELLSLHHKFDTLLEAEIKQLRGEIATMGAQLSKLVEQHENR